MKAATPITFSLLLSVLPLAASAASENGMANQPATSVATQAQAAGHEQGKPAQRAEGVWIDVRTEKEYNEGHLQGAHNVPVDRIAREIASISPDKDAPINLYCRSGRRSEAALQQLKAMGYTQVTNHGGYKDLVAKGLR
ncbi:MAG: rhodanese-like domain-containing protein [Lautropia sp.]|nr:rhodanese-like domain-containing protein [Lautropia sp.]